MIWCSIINSFFKFSVCQIIRGIEVPYGSMVLIGLSGTGRLTLSRLAAYILKYEVFEMEVKRNYEIIDFKHGKFIHFRFCQLLLTINVHIYFNIIRADTTYEAGT